MNELIIMSHPREMEGPRHGRSHEVISHTILVNGFIAEAFTEGSSDTYWSYGNQYDAFLADRVKHYERILICRAKIAVGKLSRHALERSMR